MYRYKKKQTHNCLPGLEESKVVRAVILLQELVHGLRNQPEASLPTEQSHAPVLVHLSTCTCTRTCYLDLYLDLFS